MTGKCSPTKGLEPGRVHAKRCRGDDCPCRLSQPTRPAGARRRRHRPPALRADPGARPGPDCRRHLLLRDQGRLGDGRSPVPRSGRRNIQRGGNRPGTSSCPQGPHRDEFQTSCLICHSARLPLGQPRSAGRSGPRSSTRWWPFTGARDPRGRGAGRGLPARHPAARARDRLPDSCDHSAPVTDARTTWPRRMKTTPRMNRARCRP